MSPQILEFDAIRNTHPTVTATAGQQLFDTNGNTVERNQTLIDAEVIRLQAVYDSQAYARSRAAEYPSIADQLDDIYHNGIDAWKATIKTTKDKYPKE